MLSEILSILVNNENLSLTQLAESAGCTNKELESALQQLELMNYIQQVVIGRKCASACCSQSNSGGCSGCQPENGPEIRSWILTPKGKKFAFIGKEN